MIHNNERKCRLLFQHNKKKALKKVHVLAAWCGPPQQSVLSALTHRAQTTLQRRSYDGHNIKGTVCKSEPTEWACQAYALSGCETDAPRGAPSKDNNDWPAGVRGTGGQGGGGGEDFK